MPSNTNGGNIMNTFSDMKVGTKLLFSFGILVALLVAIGAMAAWEISSINDKITQILDDRYAKVTIATDIDQAVNLQARDLRNAIIGAKEPQEVDRSLAKVEQGIATNNALMEKLQKMLNTPKGRELFDAMKSTREKYGEVCTVAIRLEKEGKAE
jgi:methyl-accepting chemotaxis protein